MRRHALLVATMLGLAAALSAPPVFAARSVQGAVGNVSADDGAALGPVGCRTYSAFPGGETNVNDNIASCRNIRCGNRGYVTNPTLDPGGYICPQDATQVYNGDVSDQPFYELVDANMNDATGDHILFFGVSGVCTTNSGFGNFLAADCPPPTATNCFGRIDNDDAAPPLTGTRASYGGPPHTIRAIGGLNPIPNVNVSVTGATAHLSWRNPPTYDGNMRPCPGIPLPSPVLGVRLYKNFSGDCTDPTGNDPGWTPIGSFNLGQTSTDDPLPQGAGCNFYALTVRVLGAAGAPNEMETFRVGVGSQPVGGTPESVRIVRFSAIYAGHGLVNLSWQSGVEGDVQGYYVTRAPTASGPFARVSGFIPAVGDEHAYSASDRVPAAARTYVYRLEILGRDGRVTTSGTASAVIPARPKGSRPGVR